MRSRLARSLVLALAFAAAPSPAPAVDARWHPELVAHWGPTSGALLNAPFTAVGGGFLPDANTVSNVTWQPWTLRTDPNSAFALFGGGYNAIVWGNGLFVAVGQNDASTGCLRATSTDGVTWTARNCAFDSTTIALAAVTWSGDKFVAVGGNGPKRITTSTDGISWTPQTIATDAYLSVAVNAAATSYVVLTAGGAVIQSATGLSWSSAIPLTLGSSPKSVAFGNGKFVVVGNSTFVNSSDGITWSASAAMPSSGYNAVFYDSANALFVAIGNTGVGATSPDGSTWTARTLPTTATSALARGATITLGMGTGSGYSTADVTWTSGNAPPAAVFGVAWSPTLNLFAAVARTANKTIFTNSETGAKAAGGLVDASGNVWTQNGTVPQVTTSPWYPQGFSNPAMPGAGPYSTSNYYGITTSALNVSSDFTLCAVVIPTSFAAFGMIENTWNATTNNVGWDLYFNQLDGITRLVVGTGSGNQVTASGGSATLLSQNVVCAGHASGSNFLKLNLGTTVTTTSAYTASAVNALIGQRGGTLAFTGGSTYALYFTTTPFSESNATAIQNRLFGHVATNGQVLTVTRATTATAEPKASASPSLYAYPANILRITENGALLEAATTNLLLQSADLSNAAYSTVGTCTMTANQGVFADGTTTMAKAQCSGTLDQRFQSATVSSSTGPWTASTWLASPTGASIQSLVVSLGAGAATSCTCTRADGGACTVGTATLATPVNAAFTTGTGTLATGTYFYRVSALNAAGQPTAASTETSLAITGPAGVNVNWGAVSGAFQYQIFGRTTGAEQLLATVNAPTVTFLDNGSLTPLGALPGVSNASIGFAYATVGTTAVRMALSCSSSVATTSVAAGAHDGQFNATSNIGGFFGGAQLEVAGYASSYIAATTAAVVRNADSISVANQLSPGPFCVTGTWVPALAPFGTWALGTLGATRDLWVFGTAGAANSARVRTPINGSIVFEVVDGAAANKTWTVAAGALTGSTAYTIAACSDNAGTGTVALNGAAQSVTVAGAGSGVLSAMGAVSETGIAAAVKNFKVCQRSNPAACY